MATRKGPKKLSNPVSVSGEGDRFQARVQASYLLAILSGDARFGLANEVVGLRFQAQLDYRTDDLVCTVMQDDGSTFVVAMQVKLTIKARAGDGPFKDAVAAAWYDFSAPKAFRRDVDRLSIAYSRDSGGSTVFAAHQVCDKARSTPGPAEFLRSALEPDYSSEPQRDAFAAIKAVVVAEAGAVSDEDLHQFCRHLWFVEHRLATDETPDIAHLIAEIRGSLGRSAHGGPPQVWNTLVATCFKLNALGATITRDNARTFFDSAKLVADFARHRNSEVSGAASELQAPTETQPPRSLNTGLHFVEQRACSGELLTDSAALGDAVPTAAKNLLSNQLDAVNDLIKAFRYQDAKAQLSVLGRDLAPFDDAQRARWYLLRATCAWHTESAEAAAKDFLKAAEIYPGEERNAAAKIRGLLLSERVPEALEAAEQALERFPESLFVWSARANAQILAGQVPDEASLSAAHTNSADALQLVAAGLRHAGQLADAADVSLRSLSADKPGFFVRAAALSHVLDWAAQDNVHTALRVLTPDIKAKLKAVSDAFEPRAERLWAVQSESVVSVAASNLGTALLLQGKPETALEVAREGRSHGRTRPELVRVELEALHDLGRTEEMFRLGRASLADLKEGGLVALAQVAANQGDHEMASILLEHAQSRPDIEAEAKEVLQGTRLLALWNGKQRATVATELMGFAVEQTSSLALLGAVSRLALTSDKPKAEAALSRLLALAGEKPPPEVRLLLADLYMDLKDYRKAASHYESVLPQQAVSELHGRLLFCLLRSGNRQRAKNLVARLPDGWTANDNLRALASELARDAGDWLLLSRLAQAQFAANPGEIGSWLFRYMVAIRELSVSEVKELIDQAPLDLEGTAQQTAQLAVLEFRLGLHRKGVLRLYRMRRLHPDQVETASALMTAFLAYNQPIPPVDETGEVVAPGTHFVVEGPGGLTHTTVDPQELIGLPGHQEFRPVDFPAVLPFIGKGAGEEVQLDGGFAGPRVYRVVSVGSAYRRQMALAQEQVETSLEPPPNLWTLKVKDGPDGEADFSELHENLKRQSEQILKSLQIYQDLPCTLGGLSRMIGRDSVELVQGWPTGLDTGSLYASDGTAEEFDRAREVLLRNEAGYLIDAPTMAELVRLDAVKALGALPAVFATTETEEVLRLKLEELQDKGPEGRVFDDNGQMRFSEFTPQAQEQARKQAQAAVDALRAFCQVVPAYGPESKPEFLEHAERILSSEERALLSAALERNLSVLTTDQRLRQIATQVKIPGIWPQMLMQFAVAKGAMTMRECSLGVLKLLLSNRSFVRLTPEDLWTLCHQSTPWVQFGIARLKVYLAKPSVDFESTFAILQEFVVLATLRGTRVAALAELLRHLSEGIMRHPSGSLEAVKELVSAVARVIAISKNIPYEPLEAFEVMRGRQHVEFLARAAMDGLEWASSEPEDRPVRLVVHLVTKRPLLMYDPPKVLAGAP